MSEITILAGQPTARQRAMSAMAIAWAAFCGLLAADMVLPMLPRVALRLHASADMAQFSIAVFFLGLAFSRLFLVSFSDAWGRRPVILLGIGIMVLGSLIASLANNIEFLVIGRLLSGIGAAGTVGMVGVVTADCFEGNDLIRFLSMNSMLIFIAPAVAPLLGAWIGLDWGWRGVFEAILIIHVMLYFAMRSLPETRRQVNTAPFISHLRQHAILCWRDREFVVYTLVNTLIFAVYMAYLTASPFIFQWHFHYTVAQFTALTTVLVCSQLLARVINVVILQYCTVCQLTKLCLWMMLLASIGLGFEVLFHPRPVALAAWIMGAILPGAMLSPILYAGAMSNHREAMGVASALHGSVKMLGAFACSFLVAMLAKHPLLFLSIAFLLTAVISCITMERLRRQGSLSTLCDQKMP